MKPEEDEVSLVVESGNLSANKLWILRKQSSKHAADAVAQSGGEVVQNDLRGVLCWLLSFSLNHKHTEIQFNRALTAKFH